MKTLKPFADDRASQAIDGLTIENGRTKLSLYGSLDIGRDEAGLAKARALKAILDATVAALEASDALPDKPKPPRPTKTLKNPFA
jgi:hypothetical protein